MAKLATGGMAEIFLARLDGAAGFEKLLCVKRMLPQFVKDQSLVAMFLAEAKIAAQISHPNVCHVFELGELDGRYFIAMEYLQGVPLTCFRRRDLYPLDTEPRLVAGLGIQACDGLHHAHNLAKSDGTSLEVVHRDVSTNNLFATVDGMVKVLDFGIAKIQDASVRTSTGSVKGTYGYMAPEQLRGERVDRRTDVFALGVVLWELFARRHLFRRETDFLTFQALTSETIHDICKLRPDLPAPLGAAIAKALSRDRTLRHATTRAFAEALTRAVEPLGGPLTVPAISEHITRVFAPQLDEQRQLVQVVRDGGAFELDDDLGPGVGHGAELMTTPVSVVSSVENVGVSTATPAQISPPAARGHSAARMALVAVLALIVGGIAVFFVLNNRETSVHADAAAVALGPPADADALSANVQVGAHPLVTDAPGAVADAAIAPIDAGVPATPKRPLVKRPTVKRPATPPTDPCSSNATGPISDACFGNAPVAGAAPGYVTLKSSSPAVIFIDGVEHGNAPVAMLKLAAGKHTVRAVSATGEQTFSITVVSLKVATRTLAW